MTAIFLAEQLLNSYRITQLKCDYSNQGTWKKIIQSQQFLKTKDSQFLLQDDQ